MGRLGFDHGDIRLLFNIWRMNLADKYLGSALGGVWAFLNPLVMLALFTFVFGYVYQARLPGAESTLSYAIWLICGYGPWLATTEALTAAAQSIIGNSGLVKNVAFKTEVLPFAATLLGLVPLFVSLAFLLLLQLLNGDSWSWNLLWLPVIIVIHFLLLAAIGLMLAAVTTFVRDFGIVLPNLLLILLFATPIFYSIDAIPRIFAAVSQFNPIYLITDMYRAVFLRHQGPNLIGLLALGLTSFGVLFFNLTVFRRVKGFFPSVI